MLQRVSELHGFVGLSGILLCAVPRANSAPSTLQHLLPSDVQGHRVQTRGKQIFVF